METNDKPRKKPLIILASARPDFAYTIEQILKANDFDVYATKCGCLNAQTIESLHADLFLADCNIVHGACLCTVESIRRINKSIPVVFVTENAEEEELLKAYEAGIDSFIQGPVSMRLLVAHIKAIMSKRDGASDEEPHTAGEFTLDAESCTLYFRDTPIKLPYMEARLLDILISKKNKVCETEQLIKLLWGKESEVRTSNNINIYIYNLRKILKRDPNVQLVNIRGVGFKLTETAPASSATAPASQG